MSGVNFVSSVVALPLFKTFATCTTALALKMSSLAWQTVLVMMSSGGYGVRYPEDLKKTPLNPNPSPDQIKPFEPAERLRRLMGHDIENNLPFFAVGLFYTLLNAGPAWPLQLYTAAKFVHHFVVLAGLYHEIRAMAWTTANASFLYMSYLVLKALYP